MDAQASRARAKGTSQDGLEPAGSTERGIREGIDDEVAAAQVFIVVLVMAALGGA